ncbi:MAG: hypothetical protein IKU52_00530 [Clostridia bacterium]|nr:hypothetical protein [Clostridia bacterium]
MLRQELKKMSRSELLEMLIDQTNENNRLREQLGEARQKLLDKNIVCEEAGSIAKAALELNGIFEAAQAACDQYTENVKERSAHLEEICVEKERETEEKCARMIEEAKVQSQAYWDEVNEKVETLMSQSAILREILSANKK